MDIDGLKRPTQTGRKFVVPTDLDMGFIGYPCVDLSSLNVEQGQFTDTSTATGKGNWDEEGRKGDTGAEWSSKTTRYINPTG